MLLLLKMLLVLSCLRVAIVEAVVLVNVDVGGGVVVVTVMNLAWNVFYANDEAAALVVVVIKGDAVLFRL